jgi:hypothetical protein
MNTNLAPAPALILTEDEAFGLLDLCLMSNAEFDEYQNAAMQKLTDLVRSHVASTSDSSALEADAETEAIPMAEVMACIKANKEERIETAVQNAMRDHSGRVCFRPLAQHR